MNSTYYPRNTSVTPPVTGKQEQFMDREALKMMSVSFLAFVFWPVTLMAVVAVAVQSRGRNNVDRDYAAMFCVVMTGCWVTVAIGVATILHAIEAV